jgi:hypothetical protein
MRRFRRWVVLGTLLGALAGGCTGGDDDTDGTSADAGDVDDRAGDGHWEDGDAQEIRDGRT